MRCPSSGSYSCPRSLVLQRSSLLGDVLEGVVQPVVEGDVALAVLVDGLEVFLALGDASLNKQKMVPISLDANKRH
jgi:hypothetical protein